MEKCTGVLSDLISFSKPLQHVTAFFVVLPQIIEYKKIIYGNMYKILDVVYVNEEAYILQGLDLEAVFGGNPLLIDEYHCAQSYEENGRVGVIYDEKKTIPPIYERISLFTMDNCLTAFAVVKYNGKYGLLTCENHVIEECIYDSISYFYKPKKNNTLTSPLKLILGSEYKYIDLYSDTTIKTTKNYHYMGRFCKRRCEADPLWPFRRIAVLDRLGRIPLRLFCRPLRRAL